MKYNIYVTELNHHDLVTLFSDSLYSNGYMGVNLDAKFYDFYDKIPAEKKSGECIEDKIADVLLNGGKVKIVDFNAEGELCNDKNGIKAYLDEGENGIYEIGLDDILKGMSSNDALPYVRETFLSETGGDMWDAYNIMQIVCFGEEIYG